MRNRWNVAVVVGLLGALVACGSDSTDGSATVPAGTSTATTTPATTEPSVDVTARLLTPADVGNGWQEASPVGDADFGDAWQIPCDDVAINPTMVDVLRPSAGTQFEPTDGSSRHLIEFVTTGVGDELATALDAYIGAVASCPANATWGGAPVTVSSLDLGQVGDRGAAYTIVTGEGTGASTITWYVRNASVRVGDHIIALGLAEILDGDSVQPAVSDAQFVDMVRAAIGKFGV